MDEPAVCVYSPEENSLGYTKRRLASKKREVTDPLYCPCMTLSGVLCPNSWPPAQKGRGAVGVGAEERFCAKCQHVITEEQSLRGTVTDIDTLLRGFLRVEK